MWMVPPRTMCRRHLLGEHVEIHMAAASLRLGRSLDGFLEKGLLELHNLRARHEALVAEMKRRGYRHASPLERVTRRGGKIDRERNARELAERCEACAELQGVPAKRRRAGR